MTTVATLGGGADIITLHTARNTFALPTAANILPIPTGDSSCSRWRHRGGGPLNVLITLSADKATTFDKALGAFGLLDGAPHLAGLLNGGAPITIPGATTPVSFEIACGMFDHLYVGPIEGTATASASGLVTVKARPIWLSEA